MVFSIPPEQQTPFVHDSEPPICPCGHPNPPSAPAGLDVERLAEILSGHRLANGHYIPLLIQASDGKDRLMGNQEFARHLAAEYARLEHDRP